MNKVIGDTKKRTTDTLTNVLRTTSLENIGNYFDTYTEKLASEERPFAEYMRTMFKKKGLRQQDVFLAADISEGYGYKLISEEKRSKQRDVIIRICVVAGFDLEETQRALKLYGMSPLYPKVRRDAVLIVAINHGVREIADVNQMLVSYGFESLYACRPAE